MSSSVQEMRKRAAQPGTREAPKNRTGRHPNDGHVTWSGGNPTGGSILTSVICRTLPARIQTKSSRTPHPHPAYPGLPKQHPLSPIEVSGRLKRESEPRLALALCALLVALTCPDSPRSSLPSQTTKHTKYKRHRPLRNLVCDQTGFVLLLLRLSSRLLSLIYLLSPSSIGTSAHRSFRPGLGTSLTHAAKRAQDSPLPSPSLPISLGTNSLLVPER